MAQVEEIQRQKTFEERKGEGTHHNQVVPCNESANDTNQSSPVESRGLVAN